VKRKLFAPVLCLLFFSTALDGQVSSNDKYKGYAIEVDEDSLDVEVQQRLTPFELHQIATEYSDYNVNFTSLDLLVETMKGYYREDGRILNDFQLTSTERALMREYIRHQESENNWVEDESKQPEPKVAIHLKRAGWFKNASLSVAGLSIGLSSFLVQADPINQKTANAILISGSIVAVALQIAGNLELVKAGDEIE
jgi:hypothetical protein